MAAAIHCRKLPDDRIPTFAEFTALPYYDRTDPQLVGQLYCMGCDEYGHKTYFMGLWTERSKLNAAIQAFLDVAGVGRSEYLLQDAFPLINFSTKLGGLLSKRYHFTSFGRKITVWGMQRQYWSFVAMVKSVKEKCGRVAEK